MASNSPTDLSCYVAPAKVLAAAGIHVKGVLPEVVRCPGCRQDTLTIYLDPANSTTGRWLFCRNCSFSGDSIELHGMVQRSPCLDHAVDQVVHSGLFSGEPRNLTPGTINAYLNAYPKRRQFVDCGWKRLRSNLSRNVQPDLLHRVQTLNLWGNWHHSKNTLDRYIGGGTASEINHIFEKELLPKQGFRTNLVLPYQDVPGRIAMFQFLGDFENSLFKTMLPPSFNIKPEGGLGMLDLLDSNEDEVIAFEDPIFALQLQRRHTVDAIEPLKMVFYNESTERSWESVNARKVIFWSPDISWRIFHQARLVRNGYIAERPLIENTRERHNAYLTDRPAFEVVRIIKQYARPWMEFFSSWSLNAKESLVRETVNRLNLSTQERQQIIELTARSGRVRIEHLLSIAATEGRTIVVNRINLTEKPHGWFIKNTQVEEQILDVSIRLFREIVDPETDKVFWHGGIIHAAKMVEFVSLLEDIEKDPSRWMRDIMVKAGVGVPQLNPNWKRHFVFILKNLNMPKQVRLTTRMGIQLDGKIKFPTFTLDGGKATEEDNYLDPNNTPGLCIRPPLARLPRPGDEHNDLRTTVLCGFVGLVHGWLSSLREIPVAPTIFVGPLGSVAHAALRHLSTILGLPRRELRYAWHPNFQRLDNTTRMNMPTCVETHGYGLLRDFPNPLNDLLFLQTDRAEAIVLAAGGNWLRIKAPAINRELRALPPADDLLNYLADLQMRQFELDPHGELLDVLIADFCRWYETYLGPQPQLEPDMRKAMMAPPLPADALFDVCFFLVQAGKMALSLEDLSHYVKNGIVDDRRVQSAGLVHSSKHKAVYVSRNKVSAALLRDRLPTVDFINATRDLTNRQLCVPGVETPYGWLIDRAYWDARMLLWQKMEG